jgi:para-nitrobenzyl esterase
VGEDTRAPQKVADAMSAAWIAFARSGSPNASGLPLWPAYDPRKRATMTFDVVSASVDDPLRREHAVLAPILAPPALP